MYYAVCVTAAAVLYVITLQAAWSPLRSGIVSLQATSTLPNWWKVYVLDYCQTLTERNRIGPSIPLSSCTWVFISLLMLYAFARLYQRIVGRFGFSGEWSRSAIFYYAGLREILTGAGFAATGGVAAMFPQRAIARTGLSLWAHYWLIVLLIMGALLPHATLDRTLLLGKARRGATALLVLSFFVFTQIAIDLFHTLWVTLGFAVFSS